MGVFKQVALNEFAPGIHKLFKLMLACNRFFSYWNTNMGWVVKGGDPPRCVTGLDAMHGYASTGQSMPRMYVNTAWGDDVGNIELCV